MSEFYIDQDGRRQGEHDRYYPNGELWETINYKNNQKVILLAKKVENNSNKYKKQLNDCKNKLSTKKFIIF